MVLKRSRPSGQRREELWAAVSGDALQEEPDKRGKDPPSRNPESRGEKSRVVRTAPGEHHCSHLGAS